MTAKKPLRLFQGYGVELEYMIVARDSLAVLPVTDLVLEAAAGKMVNEIERGVMCWSNELVLHVIELKTNGPAVALQGLAPELVFAAGRYRRFTPAVCVIAGAAAGLVPGLLDPLFFYPEWTASWKVAFLLITALSSALIAGLGSHLLAQRLARTGVLDAFPLGRERIVR